MADQIASLGITVSADGAIVVVNQLNSSLKQLGTTSERTGRSVSGLNARHGEAVSRTGAHSLGLAKVERAMSGVLERSTGLDSALGVVGSTFLNFGIGHLYTVAIVAGLAVVAKAWDEITKSARGAKKAQEDAIKNIGNTISLKAAGPGGQNVLDLGQASAALTRMQTERAGVQAQLNAPVKPGDIGTFVVRAQLKDKLSKLNDDIENLSKQIQVTKGYIAEDIRKADLDSLAKHQRELDEALAKRKAAEEEAQANLIRYTELMARTYGTLGRGHTPYAQSKIAGDERYNTAYGVAASEIMGRIPTSTAFEMPSIDMGPVVAQQQSDREKHEREQLVKLGILHEDNSGIKAAIQGTAGAIGAILASALNIGGGGVGSAIGGALGSGAGSIAGSFLTKGAGALSSGIWGVVGGVAGGLLGSALGGLFGSHQHAVDRNTRALNNLTASLSNAPSGFKVANYNYNAAEARRSYRATVETARREATRGGRTGFSLAAA